MLEESMLKRFLSLVLFVSLQVPFICKADQEPVVDTAQADEVVSYSSLQKITVNVTSLGLSDAGTLLVLIKELASQIDEQEAAELFISFQQELMDSINDKTVAIMQEDFAQGAELNAEYVMLLYSKLMRVLLDITPAQRMYIGILHYVLDAEILKEAENNMIARTQSLLPNIDTMINTKLAAIDQNDKKLIFETYAQVSQDLFKDIFNSYLDTIKNYYGFVDDREIPMAGPENTCIGLSPEWAKMIEESNTSNNGEQATQEK